MKTYTPLIIPKDSAWERKTWRSYAPHWLLNFIDGVKNIIKWAPIIYKDKNWDHSYIYSIIEFKLLQQRNCLVKANRHTNIWETNRDITICLNLIQRIKENYYSTEYFEYYESKHWFKPTDETNQFYTSYTELIWEKFHNYFGKYPLQYKKAKKEIRNKGKMTGYRSKEKIARYIGNENEQRAKNLLFKILNEKLNHWWD
jgi:hypothetical protein